MVAIGGRLASARLLPVAVVAASALIGISGASCARHIAQRAQTPQAQISPMPSAQRSASQADAPRRRVDEAGNPAIRPHQQPKPGPGEPDVAPASPSVGTTGATGTSGGPGTTSLTGSSSVVITPDQPRRVSSDTWRANDQPVAGRTPGPAGGYRRLVGALLALSAGALAVLWMVTRRMKHHTAG